ncbi:MAG: O-antigen ligase family protein [Burkholderiales bacterium]|nr:O-antigen ligase family protein [Burkholderiales bacterium]
MSMLSVSKAADSSAKWAAVAVGFSVPISVALDNALLLAILVLWLVGANFREKYGIIRKNPVALASLALIGLLAIGMLYGSASIHEAVNTLGKYIDLLFIPIFITLFSDSKTRRHALAAFMTAMMLTLFLSYMLKMGILHQNSILRGFAGNPYVFKLYITQNFFMAFASMVLATWFFHEKDPRKRLLWGILTLLALINVLFMVYGRTGYIVLALLVPYLFIRKLGKKGLLIGIVVTLVFGSMAYFGSKVFHERVSLATDEFTHWQPEKAADTTNSIGQRMEFYSNTLKIIEKHPIFGVGTGGFEQAYAAQVANTKMLQTHNPHNEFLLIMVQTGLPGLVLLLLLFFKQWREASSLSEKETYLARALVLAMISGCLFNSFLLDHAEGLFFAFMTGVLFSGKTKT